MILCKYNWCILGNFYCLILQFCCECWCAWTCLVIFDVDRNILELIMDVFFLEEDDGNELFITEEPREEV